MTSVLEGKMGVWLCMDYTQTLLHYILPQPHYILQMNSQTWEGEEGRGGWRRKKRRMLQWKGFIFIKASFTIKVGHTFSPELLLSHVHLSTQCVHSPSLLPLFHHMWLQLVQSEHEQL